MPKTHSTTHGMKGTPEYYAWSHMIQRCTNPNCKEYQWYGARGITICDTWLTFAGFFADMGLRPTVRHTLERINNKGNYEPENCRWATWFEQARNRRSTRMIIWDNRAQCLTDWASEIGISRQTLRIRLAKHPLEKAMKGR